MATAPSVPRVEGYSLAEKLGSGSYADVYKGYKKGGKEVVAVKCVVKNKLSKTALNNLISEIEILKSLCHTNIVKLKDFCWDDTHVFIIMEYCGGGMKKFAKDFCNSLCWLFFIYEKRILAIFDLKPQNILIASKKLQILKIADFGLAQYITDDDKNSVLKGSPLYMAPEIVLKRQYDARADIWSVGIILYECLFGKAPYSSKSFDELFSKIKANKPIEIPSNANISNECRNFLKGCLQRELSKRFDFNSFFDHPFVDLAHAPSSDSINKATEHLTKAIEDDKLGNCKEALQSYDEALKYLIPMMHSEVDSLKRMSLRKKINEYINRMETIKSQVSGES
ncbi:Serine/threonine-protein kinase ULK3 [Armadillidium nasatum]|uniref:non-specific serine/threonine protein kinase n=1 Tax=Armadillidium nasatum TaxID=96803 RepID=A0A5N5TPE4_9CRUS|nr:Serine/threonine-protein kinase ULK3 [Armadillidium nasatum]